MSRTKHDKKRQQPPKVPSKREKLPDFDIRADDGFVIEYSYSDASDDDGDDD